MDDKLSSYLFNLSTLKNKQSHYVQKAMPSHILFDTLFVTQQKLRFYFVINNKFTLIG